MSLGDVVAARRFYEVAASAGVARAATAVGQTYDPLYLRQAGVHGLRADSSKAKQWYEQGARGGDAVAVERLNGLLNEVVERR